MTDSLEPPRLESVPKIKKTPMQTPLHSEHLRGGAKMTDFHGWELPLSYGGGAISEHHHVRNACGVFDVSHMAQFEVTGPRSCDFIESILPSSVQHIIPGRGRYSCLLARDGGVLDDLFVYSLAADHFLLCVNGARHNAVLVHLMEWSVVGHREDGSFGSDAKKLDGVDVKDCCDDWALLAIQGPRSRESLQRFLAPGDLERAHQLAYTHIISVAVAPNVLQASDLQQNPGLRCWLARTGYTGELGYELFVPPSLAVGVWRALMAGGVDHKDVPGTSDQAIDQAMVRPIGLAARDSLRLEAGFMLYGSDLHEELTPYDVSLGWLISKSKTRYCGYEGLKERYGEDFLSGKVDELGRLRGFVMKDRTIARGGMKVYADVSRSYNSGNHSGVHSDQKSLDKHSSMVCVGEVTSGAFLPTLGCAGGLLLLDANYTGLKAVSGNNAEGVNNLIRDDSSSKAMEVWVEVRGKMRAASLAPLPHYVSRARG